jgi:putative DNA primase/helicase
MTAPSRDDPGAYKAWAMRSLASTTREPEVPTDSWDHVFRATFSTEPEPMTDEMAEEMARDAAFGPAVTMPAPIPEIEEQEAPFGGFGIDSAEDYRQAQWLAIMFRHRWRYDTVTQLWHGFAAPGIWLPDSGGAIKFAVARLAADVLSAGAATEAERKARLRLLTVAGVDKALEALSTFADYSTDGHDWDRDPYMLGTASGVTDLRTGALAFKHWQDGSSLLVSKSTRVKFKPEATCPLFDAFLLDVMAGDEEMVRFLWRWYGMAAIGNTVEQKFMMMLGRGRNGKFVLTSTMRHALGDYSTAPDSSLYMRSKRGTATSDAPRADLLDLLGVRETTMSEPTGGAFNEELLKAHTGSDPIRARTLHSKVFVQFDPSHTIVILTNELPSITDVGPSMQGRVIVVPFTVSYLGREDRDLPERLKSEAEGILARRIREAKAYITEGLGPIPKRVIEASAEFISDNDPLGPYLTAHCILAPGDPKTKIKTVELRQDYEQWCARGEAFGGGDCDIVNSTVFGRSLRSAGVDLDSGRRYYTGIRLKSANELAGSAPEEDED